MAGLLIGIHRDRHGWHSRWSRYCEEYNVPYIVFDMLSDNWVERAKQCNVVLFKTSMDPVNIGIFKERVYFLSELLGVETFPNLQSFWHFDSKAIQRDIFFHFGLRTPRTIVSTVAADVDAIEQVFPDGFIMKDSAGAGASRVRKVRTSTWRLRTLKLWQMHTIFYRATNYLSNKLGFSVARSPQLLAQEQIPNAGYDLRVVTIGHNYAYIFKRKVRPGDFRASGSGIVDYSWDDSYYEILSGCLAFSRTMGFNAMAYDVIVDLNGEWYVIEMSCQYTGKALLKCPHCFLVSDDGMRFERLRVDDPAELYIRAAVETVSAVSREGGMRD